MKTVRMCIIAALGALVGLGGGAAAVAECAVEEERAPLFQAVAEGLSDFCFDPLQVLERSAPFVPTSVRWPFERPLGATLPAADALKEAGVLAGTVGPSEVAMRVVSRVHRVNEPLPVEKLSLAAAAAPWRIRDGARERLCYTHPVVSSVTLRQPPVKTLMGNVMVVTYRYRLERVAPWAATEAVQEAIPDLRRAFLGAGQPHLMALVQTETGWRRAW